ncbi:MAG: HEPN domain-containing protein [Candidatus Methanoperedens sp.]
MRRHEDWLKQADSDMCAAEDSASSNHYEWACFQAQQAAEKARLFFYRNTKGLFHTG